MRLVLLLLSLLSAPAFAADAVVILKSASFPEPGVLRIAAEVFYSQNAANVREAKVFNGFSHTIAFTKSPNMSAAALLTHVRDEIVRRANLEGIYVHIIFLGLDRIVADQNVVQTVTRPQ
jgi:hypothetical protein